MQKKYSLQIIISTLFIGITILLGGVLSWHSFNKTSEIMLGSAHDLYERISQELILDFKTQYGPLAGGLRQFRLLPIIKADNFAQRIAYLPNFKAVLKSDKAVSFTGIAYSDGDYLGFSDIENNYVRKTFQVPARASYMLLYVKGANAESGFDAGKEYRVFYDDSLREVSRSIGEKTQFDARQRPWYQQATDVPSATNPYLLYGSNVVGLSVMSKTPEPGVVVVFGVLLENLSQTISDYQLTPSSEVVLVNAKGEAFAHKNLGKVITKKRLEMMAATNGERLQLAHLAGLESGVLGFLSKQLEVKEQHLDFEYSNRRWIGTMQVIAKTGNVDLYALMVSPVTELLVDAIAIRWRLIQIAFFILLMFIPIIWLSSRKISAPLQVLAQEAKAISRFDFSETDSSPSFIKEVAELDTAMAMMKSTISNFIKLIDSLAGEKDLDVLLKSITEETMKISQSDAALIYLMDETDECLKADFLCNKEGRKIHIDGLAEMSLEDVSQLVEGDNEQDSVTLVLDENSGNKLAPLLDALNATSLNCVLLLLKNRNNEVIGLLCLINRDLKASSNNQRAESAASASNIEFVQALSGFAAVTLESRQLFNMQEALLHSFIELIAGAIDAKSPYTSGHCQRVPEITFLLAEAACESTTKNYKDFNLNEDEWKELRVACWLHDCGKVTTPEYVVDKATKLETIYDRIHEVRTRFEVLKRDAEIDCWQKISDGGDAKALQENFKQQCHQLDDDFAFLAECNIGGEFMADEKIERLQKISERTWMRTIDDNLGLSWEELNRKQNKNEPLPVEEKLLADKVEHLIERHEVDKMPKDNQWGFKVDTPDYKYNRGELYNLSVKRGTLSAEERYMINGHMIQTVIMLNQLPYPKNLSNVPLIAGSHHETMDGKGYPKRLVMSEQPLTARMMVIADIFEALTASDRPYKKAKTLTESLRILSFMRNDKHIDADLFDLFLSSGVYLDYAQKFLSPEQIDEVDVADYLS